MMRTLAAQWFAGQQVGNSLSGWVNDALHRQADHDRRLRALDDFLAAYEAEHGEITGEQVVGAARRTRTRAVVVRGRGVA